MKDRKLNIQTLEVTSFITILDQKRLVGGDVSDLVDCPPKTAAPGCTINDEVETTCPLTEPITGICSNECGKFDKFS